MKQYFYYARFVILSLLCASAFSDNNDNVILTTRVFAYTEVVKQDTAKAEANNYTSPLSTIGYRYIDALANNNELINSICSVNKQTQQDCLTGLFGLNSELIGLQNAISVYNQSYNILDSNHDKLSGLLEMINSDVSQIQYILSSYYNALVIKE